MKSYFQLLWAAICNRPIAHKLETPINLGDARGAYISRITFRPEAFGAVWDCAAS